jgi:hypothetical protein
MYFDESDEGDKKNEANKNGVNSEEEKSISKSVVNVNKNDNCNIM